MKMFLKENVFDSALERIRYLFDEFPNIIVAFSGGKDSTVCLQLALQVAREKKRLPLNVMFIDQEAEWDTVIDYVREVMYNPDIKPYWFQMPIKIFNSTSTIHPWLYCWAEGEEWIRPKEEISIKENKYGTERFKFLFGNIVDTEFPDTPTAYIAGVRCEESPSRMIGLTSKATYKWITWGNANNKKLNHFTFYPLYDWSYRDIWKSIFDHGWDYCKIYDYMYQYGVRVMNMRVSNVHHETAINSLFYLQEIEADNWNRITKRISGISTAGQTKRDMFFIKDLPYMFASWTEYRDYLLDNLITDDTVKEIYRKEFVTTDKRYCDNAMIVKSLCMIEINTILANDYYFTKLNNWKRAPQINSWLKFRENGKADPYPNIYIDYERFKKADSVKA